MQTVFLKQNIGLMPGHNFFLWESVIYRHGRRISVSLMSDSQHLPVSPTAERILKTPLGFVLDCLQSSQVPFNKSGNEFISAVILPQYLP